MPLSSACQNRRTPASGFDAAQSVDHLAEDAGLLHRQLRGVNAERRSERKSRKDQRQQARSDVSRSLILGLPAGFDKAGRLIASGQKTTFCLVPASRLCPR